MATPAWDELLVNRDQLTSYYTEIPALDSLVIRSVHLSRYGPALTIRADLSRFPDRAPVEWTEAGCDRFECQLHFVLAEEGIRMRGRPDGTAAAVRYSLSDSRRLRAEMRGENLELDFTAHENLQVSHLSAYRSTDGDPYAARRWFASRIDQRLFQVLPPPTRKPFYDRP